ncbi:MAG: putative aminohydrolase SsnA [Spirochaetes bacterium]|nr:putative aminohydrolase SsnA [Spirochaetota bacterium]
MTVVENVRVVGFNPPSVSEPVDVAFGDESQGGSIIAVGKGGGRGYPSAKRVTGIPYLSPGLVCSHTHLYSALARGLLADIKPSKDFGEQLAHLWWKLDRAIDRPILEYSALAGCADAVMCGVTSLVDHHASPEFIDGSLDVIRDAYEAIGLRGVLCYETTDRNGMDGARSGVRENVRFARAVDAGRKAGGKPKIEAMIGGHACFTISDETMALLSDAVASTGRGLHIHAGEDRYDASDSRHRFGADLAVRLDEARCLGPKSIVGHGVWLSKSEIELVNERDAFVAHNARSNMNNNVGYATLLPEVRNAVIGTDGMDGDVLAEFKFAFFKNRDAGGPLWPDFYLAALDRGNRLLERCFGGSFGKIEPGYPADLVLWNYATPTPLVSANVPGHFAFGLSARHVRSVAVGGRFLVEDGRPAFDMEAIFARSRDEAARLWKRMDERS